jgi:hypothetical protein
VIFSTPCIPLNNIRCACSQPCNDLYLCLLQNQPCRCHATSHCKPKESCSPSLNHCPLTYIKFITIYLYLLNHLITFNYGLIYNQLLCVAQLSKCLYKCHLSMAMFLHYKVGFTLDLNIIGFPMKNDNRPKHVCFHNQQLWANHPTFSLSLQIVQVIICSPLNMIFINSKLLYQINQLMNGNSSHNSSYKCLACHQLCWGDFQWPASPYGHHYPTKFNWKNSYINQWSCRLCSHISTKSWILSLTY